MAENGPEFAGSKGSGADIDLSVPLPGAHTGRRILKVEDIPDDYWLDSASEAGTSYAQLLGLTFDTATKSWSIANAESLVSTWVAKKAAVATNVTSAQLDEVKTAIVADAAEVISTRGSLKDWISGGQIFKSTSAATTKTE